MTVTLSARLRAIAEAVPRRAAMADIGTDHALLPAHLVGSGAVPRAIATDSRSGPLARARVTLGEHGIDQVELRQGDGLRPLAVGEVVTVVIAGMGGARTCRILDDAPQIVAALSLVVLQPNTDWPLVREHLARRGLVLASERIVEDDGRFYWIAAATPGGEPWALDEPDRELGPRLREHGDDVFTAWLRYREGRLQAAIARVEATSDRSADGLRRKLAIVQTELARRA